ncbi:MAG: hypothetical protein R3C26_25460 [Calditrichia bacterium]
MATHKSDLINALRETATRLSNGANYEWGHMARCNCGHLVQTVTKMSDKGIARAVEFDLDEWTEYAKDICDGSGSRAENLFLALREVGFNYDDVIHLENLSDKRVLSRIENGDYLRKNNPEDVSCYMQTLADVLEEEAV